MDTAVLQIAPVQQSLARRTVFVIGLLLSIVYTNRVTADIEIRDVSAAEAAEILKENPKIKILDVRTGLEFRLGHIKDAVNLNYYSRKFETNLAELDKDITWLVHCRTGVRSGKTLPLMKAAGFKSVIHLKDGIVDWKDAGLPLTK